MPYLERARVCVVPLLHGAGVKGKIIESLLAGTPVVTTRIGAEGLDLRDGEHAVVADTPRSSQPDWSVCSRMSASGSGWPTPDIR